MYNSITEQKIKQIPQIGEIDLDRLPQELTKIYAQTVSLRRQFAEGTNPFSDEEFINSLRLLQSLVVNLEIILITIPKHEKKESIAFVAGTAQRLIYKIGLVNKGSSQILDIDTISPLISAVLLFLIGNSQADAAEIASESLDIESLSPTKKKLASYIQRLAKGNLFSIINDPLKEEEINLDNSQDAALDFLWRYLGLGIYDIASRLLGNPINESNENYFARVIDLSKYDDDFEGQINVFTGPLHLAKLLNILKEDILNRGITNIPPPKGVDAIKWKSFLEKLAKDKPYLWENHNEVVNTNFLEIGISAVLTLPTGAGKSTLSELKIASSLFSEKKVIYLVPTHALEDQVNKNFRLLFDEHKENNNEVDGEFTEAVNIDSFPILVMTPERCLTVLNMIPDLFKSVGLIIFDEFHLIHGTNIKRDRRSVDAMYCLISLFSVAPQADFLLISAMVENGEEIAEWIYSVTGRECKIFNSSWKPTRQLHGCLIFDESNVSDLNEKIRVAKGIKKTKNPPSSLKKSLTISPYCFFSLRNIWETDENSDYYRGQIIEDQVLLGINNNWRLTTNRNDIAAKFAVHFSSLGLKTLIFVDNPKIAHSTSHKISEHLNNRKNCYSEFIKSHANEFESLTLELGSPAHTYFNNQYNVGIHHGLLLPIERTLIEEYFKREDGSIVLVATATLAQGINLPAEIVIIAGDDRYTEDSKYRERVPPHELLNAAGRAGRAGLSSQGAVILIPGEVVTIKESTISTRWWKLKKEVFSKSDQCLKVEDPLEHFLDSIKDESLPLDTDQINIMYRFKSENFSELETKELFQKSFYAYKKVKNNNKEEFSSEINNLLKRRNELDALSEDINWTKEISYKTGVDPNLILKLGNTLDQENFSDFINFSIIELIDWYFNWVQSDNDHINKIYTKQSTIDQIKQAIGIKVETEGNNEIVKKLQLLKELLILYVKGSSLDKINKAISEQDDIHLKKARNFVIRLVPEISFSFGLLSMVIIEKAQQKGVSKSELSWTIKMLASCIREGFDDVQKFFYKQRNKLLTRVDTHNKFNLAKK